MNPWFWAIGSVLVAIAEMHSPGSYLIWIAAGGIITSLLSSIFDLSITAQLSVFIVACIGTCTLGFFVYQRLGTLSVKTGPRNRRDLELIGAKGIVAEAITNGHGKVRLGDSVWLAAGPDLIKGTPVAVTEVRGTVLVVAPLSCA
jgi:membrane protein implicated in regulation of membrane protease activity